MVSTPHSVAEPPHELAALKDNGPTPSAPKSSSAFMKRLKRNWGYYPFIIPGLILLLLFFYIPAVSAVYYAFFDWDGQTRIFIGLDNFRDLVHDPLIRDGFKNMIILTMLGLIVTVCVPLLVAELIFNVRSAHWKRFYQTTFLVAGLVPVVVLLLIWQFVYDPYFGPLNAILEQLGFGKMACLWLADPHMAIYCLVFIGFPWVSGTTVLIFLAGLNTIPPSILDYCRIDGVGSVRRFFYIDIFFIIGQLRLMTITGFIVLMQAFGLQLILTGGGPGTSTMVPGYHMYLNAFRYDRLGYASAIGLVMALIILAFTVLNLKYLKARN